MHIRISTLTKYDQPHKISVKKVGVLLLYSMEFLKTFNMAADINTITSIDQLQLEHELALTLCFRIRKGLLKKVHTQRIRNYVDWFRAQFLDPHFELEKQHIFPILGNNARVKRALANHRRIDRLLTCSCEDIKVLSLLEEELATLIRFEERTLYHKLRQTVTPEKLQEIKRRSEIQLDSNDLWEDQFWKEESSEY